ncbi:Ferritin-like domain-containing protein [Catalinimonas alkaloidigena]|uniref:Ferritin-like domain-containing protein n=1 Tax=Catalinimonas alkaloidigena TaxID=1075417 RepID=A0A1G9LQX9_9BACT|nr:ferritin-like domain-containing protein [Catalinimonas alkaloidigena]SDL64353.1 Ferritin-like domain-containing protein [Catalinimonas alkaloidigena]
MNIFTLLDQLFEGEPSATKATSRREAFTIFGDMAQKAAMAAVPLGLGALVSTPARAAHTTVPGVLNFALLLEYLENEFYAMGLDAGVIPAGSKAEAIFMQISKHEKAHVDLLKVAISGLGATPVDKPMFDFTAGGAFNPFGNYDQFLALSQAFEDTGVRAYKGQAGYLIDNDVVLTTALQIHSVEARHASEVRRLRGFQGWINRNEPNGLPAAAQPVYNGEENVMQGGVDVTTLTTIPRHVVTQSFDEPLTQEEVLAVATLFVKA